METITHEKADLENAKENFSVLEGQAPGDTSATRSAIKGRKRVQHALATTSSDLQAGKVAHSATFDQRERHSSIV